MKDINNSHCLLHQDLLILNPKKENVDFIAYLKEIKIKIK